MTPGIYAQLFIAGLLGISIMILVKLRALKIRTKVANEHFNVLDYFKDDFFTIILSFITLLIWLLIVGNVLHLKPNLINYLTGISVGVGYLGQSILTAFLSKSEEKLNKKVDEKTDQLDDLLK